MNRTYSRAARGRHPRRRYNPGFTVNDFQALLSKLGQERTAMLVGKYPDVVEPFLEKIAERLRAKGLIPAAEVVVEETGALSDRQAWTMLAELVDTALSDQPSELREALKAEFLSQAAAA